ncbi:MAG: hypothetical protein J6X66_06320 [Lachnospiraceae bacterium]|nr:hypothetical protein [Lachnospiraceae bacterium]
MSCKKLFLTGVMAAAVLTACTSDNPQQSRGPYMAEGEKKPATTPVSVPSGSPVDPCVIVEPPEIVYEDMEITIRDYKLESEDRGKNGDYEFPYADTVYQQLELSDTSKDQWPDLARELDYENQRIYEDALAEFADSYEWAYEMDDGIRFSANCCEADVYVLRADERMLCYSTSYYAMYNGPHPTMWSSCTCFDPQDGKKLEFSDVITESDPEKLASIIWDNLIGEALGEDYEFDDEQERTIRDRIESMAEGGELVWGMDDKALLIFFDSDMLMSYAFGPFSATVNIKDYPGLVNEWYLPQECTPVGGRVNKIDCGTTTYELAEILELTGRLTWEE